MFCPRVHPSPPPPSLPSLPSLYLAPSAFAWAGFRAGLGVVLPSLGALLLARTVGWVLLGTGAESRARTAIQEKYFRAQLSSGLGADRKPPRQPQPSSQQQPQARHAHEAWPAVAQAGVPHAPRMSPSPDASVQSSSSSDGAVQAGGLRRKTGTIAGGLDQYGSSSGGAGGGAFTLLPPTIHK